MMYLYITEFLLKVIRDKGIDRLQKSEKGKCTSRISQIHDRHMQSLQFDTETVQPLSPTTEGLCCWSVPSFTLAGDVYQVMESQCRTANCQQVCRECGVCVHLYTCMYCDQKAIDHVQTHSSTLQEAWEGATKTWTAVPCGIQHASGTDSSYKEDNCNPAEGNSDQSRQTICRNCANCWGGSTEGDYQ